MELAAAGLRRQPFRAHGAPLVLVPYAAQEAAVRFLRHTLSHPRGLGLFHGPPLSGKTSILRHFRASLPGDYAVAVVDGAGMPAAALLHEILNQFGYDFSLDSESERFNMVRVVAMQQTLHDHAPLLIVENANALSPISLETLCDLADLTVHGKSALRMILVSDRPMLPIVRAPAMQPIAKRVTGEFLLRSLTRAETAIYVHKKLISGGCRNPEGVLPRAVCDRLHAASGGWPGMIDRLALLALSRADRCPVRLDHVPRRRQPGGKPTEPAKLRRQAAKPRPVTTNEHRPHLILTCRGKTLKRLPLGRSRVIIGRDPHSDLRIPSDAVSRQHAVLLRSSRANVIADLNSKNGTFVNGERVTKQVLVNNDIIAVGDHRIKFIDPAAKQRATLRGTGWDDTIAQSIKRIRAVIAKRWSKLG